MPTGHGRWPRQVGWRRVLAGCRGGARRVGRDVTLLQGEFLALLGEDEVDEGLRLVEIGEARVAQVESRREMLDAVDATRVRAVLDWELSTLGDPLSDAALMWNASGTTKMWKA